MTLPQNLLQALLLSALSALSALTAPPAIAQTPATQPAAAVTAPAAKPTTAAGAVDLSAAEVRKVDKAQGRLTLKHGGIKNLDMPPVTLVFGVKDKSLLD